GGRLYTIASEQQLYVQADVDEADIGLVRLGATAHFQVDSQPGKTYEGTISRIGREADPATRTYPVEIRELTSVVGLRLGMTADVNVEGRTIRDALLIPAVALQTEQDRTQVWVLGSDSRVQSRPVRIKSRDSKTVQVIEGLRAGERVVLNPPKLSNDQTVEVVAEGNGT
ncbi:MAG: efflux RND transporter periplasmic adaptor subunit, partial [Armatimonadetes bacterium]|nr:efflux RND transporter periplasmic adaptor subunit [Armatimonadota bacterium]